jgi:hypothetical protein
VCECDWQQRVRPHPRPAGPTFESLEAIQSQSGCTNHTCMLAVEVHAPSAAMTAVGGGDTQAISTAGVTRNELQLAPPGGAELVGSHRDV